MARAKKPTKKTIKKVKEPSFYILGEILSDNSFEPFNHDIAKSPEELVEHIDSDSVDDDLTVYKLVPVAKVVPTRLELKPL